MSWNWRNVFRQRGSTADQVRVTSAPEPDLDRPEPGPGQEARRSRAEATSVPEMSGQGADSAFNQFTAYPWVYREDRSEGVPEIDATKWPKWDGQSGEAGDWPDGGGDWADPEYEPGTDQSPEPS